MLAVVSLTWLLVGTGSVVRARPSVALDKISEDERCLALCIEENIIFADPMFTTTTTTVKPAQEEHLDKKRKQEQEKVLKLRTLVISKLNFEQVMDEVREHEKEQEQ